MWLLLWVVSCCTLHSYTSLYHHCPVLKHSAMLSGDSQEADPFAVDMLRLGRRRRGAVGLPLPVVWPAVLLHDALGGAAVAQAMASEVDDVDAALAQPVSMCQPHESVTRSVLTPLDARLEPPVEAVEVVTASDAATGGSRQGATK